MYDEYLYCCTRCGEAYEIVRPGKQQPTCNCDLICILCNGEIKYHTFGTEKYPNSFGYYCDNCGPYRILNE